MANIKDHALLLVQTNNEINSIRFDVIKEEIGPMATQDSTLLGTVGKPGLMFPGKTMVYDSSTGKLDIASSVVKEYVGLIGYNDSPIDSDGQDLVKNMSGYESPGNFYVVADFHHKYLSNDWGSPGSDLDYQTRVYLGDIVEKRNDDTGDWNVVPMQIGNQHVHNEFANYPHISLAAGDSVLAATNDSDTIIKVTGNY